MGNDKKDMTATVKPLRVMSWLNNDESAALLSTALLILGKVGCEDACSSRNKKKESAPQREIQPKCRWLIELLFRKITHRWGGFDIPSAPPVMLLRSEDFFKIISAPQHHLHPNSRILSGKQILNFGPWRAKIHLFCSHWKLCVPEANTPFPASAVAEGITH